jgi:hypothetical protein
VRFDVEVKALPMVTGGLGLFAALMFGAPSALADPEVPIPPPPPPAPVQAAAGEAAPPAERPHLPSPENLPPGTSDAPVTQEGTGLTYLRELWHAVQTQEVSGKDALLLLTQRPLNPNATPPPGLAPNPTPPQPAAPAPLPAQPAPLPVESAPAPPPAPLPAPPVPAPAPLMPWLP